MDKTLQDLYYGKIFPAEQFQPLIDEFSALQQKFYQDYDDFIKKLGSPLDQEFKRIMDEQLNLLPFNFTQSFIDGFRLGAKIVIEIYGDEHQKPNYDK